MCAQNTMTMALIAASCLWLGQTTLTNAQTADKNPASATIQELMEERVKTLRRALEVLELQYREGVADLSRVYKAQDALTRHWSKRPGREKSELNSCNNTAKLLRAHS